MQTTQNKCNTNANKPQTSAKGMQNEFQRTFGPGRRGGGTGVNPFRRKRAIVGDLTRPGPWARRICLLHGHCCSACVTLLWHSCCHSCKSNFHATPLQLALLDWLTQHASCRPLNSASCLMLHKSQAVREEIPCKLVIRKCTRRSVTTHATWRSCIQG